MADDDDDDDDNDASDEAITYGLKFSGTWIRE
jgi:hypothetical protein